jgi:UDP-N-acetyl-D-mannosaminuronic acid dehydrogenase
MNITIVGIGYIGLPTAILLAEKSNSSVYGFDIDRLKVDSINNRTFKSTEPFLIEKLYDQIEKGNLIISHELQESDIYIICVPTPFNDDYSVNPNHIKSAAELISNVLKRGDLIILESTIEPGITENVLGKTLQQLTGLSPTIDFSLAYSAERVIPGNIFFELENNQRIVGGINSESAKSAAEIYKFFSKKEVLLTDLPTAEITKLFENTYRDINIAIANSFLLLSKRYGVNVWKAIELANKHPRVNILNPGNGVGGHCIAVDPWFLYKSDKYSQLIKSSRTINELMPLEFSNFIEEIRISTRSNKIVGLLGLTYKADIDDLRESPSLKVRDALVSSDYYVYLYDPFIPIDYDKKLVIQKLSTILEKTSFIILAVGHSYFRSREFISLLEASTKKIILVQSGPFIESNSDFEVYTYGK